MSDFPLPRNNFDEVPLPRFIIPANNPLFRLNRTQNREGHPYISSLYFDRSGEGRFDGPNQSYGILYTGTDFYCPFIESFGRTFEGAVTIQALRRRNLFQINCQRDLILADLTGSNLATLGLDGRISTCGRHEYQYCRSWAEHIWQHPEQIDGIRYRSRHDDDLYSVGLFDRASESLQEENLGNLIDDNPHILEQILERYPYALL